MKTKYIIVFGIAIIAIAAVYFLATTGFVVSGNDALAKCLTEKGAAMYGAEWCSHCNDQKEMFGESFKYITYIECPANEQLCTSKGITGYPTWIINGKYYSGTQELAKLAELSGCSIS